MWFREEGFLIFMETNGGYSLGIDMGSTTVKLALTDASGSVVFSHYERHNTRVLETLVGLLSKIKAEFGDVSIRPVFSGSLAMYVAKSTKAQFVQEVVAAATLVRKRHPEAKSLIDMGGEDAKLVLFSAGKAPDIRMNGSCAGGTGAYIDQMAVLLNVPIDKLDELASQSTRTYPIASRCGVFAKTDVQNLLSRKIPTADIAASIFDAVAGQIVNSLARGCEIAPSIVLCGGPLRYIQYLRKSFTRLLGLTEHDIIVPEDAQVFTATGAALSANMEREQRALSVLMEALEDLGSAKSEGTVLPPLFETPEELAHWRKERRVIDVPKRPAVDGEECFLGIDSGSTTTKIVVVGTDVNMLFHYYSANNGNPLETAIQGLREFYNGLEAEGKTVRIAKAAVTGYGEDLIKSALGIDYGIVETMAHFIAARRVEPDVSFILDIGGQDIKAIHVRNGAISDIMINEACSSGCGSFIEGFADTLGYSPSEFAELGARSHAPCDLGSRCTVFMNSRVKQSLKDGATVADLSAGLSYSVIKNCLNKVLRISAYSDIGDSVVVQGGTFRNISVFRSLEKLSGVKVSSSDNPELMGAYGAALHAMDKASTAEPGSEFVGAENLSEAVNFATRSINCSGCTNKCQVSVYKFPNGRVCYSGNKCEKIFTNDSERQERGENIFEYKRELIFNRPVKPGGLRIGIPRVLNIYENYPFWHALLTGCGFEPVLSGESSYEIYQKGLGALLSDNICFPAKLAHGHVADLVEKEVDRILLPMVVYEKKEFSESSNSFNCPIVTGYGEVLRSTRSDAGNPPVPFDTPAVNFDDLKLLKKACHKYCSGLGASRAVFLKAFDSALRAQTEFKESTVRRNQEILRKSEDKSRLAVLVASHPYHIDNLIHQQVSQTLADFGVDVVNEEIMSDAADDPFDEYCTISQWQYLNRVLKAASWATQRQRKIGFIQLNSFGCGPDSFIMDEVADLARQLGMPYSLVRVDEASSSGSIRLRLRSLVESLKLKAGDGNVSGLSAGRVAEFDKADASRKILVPWFSDFHSPLVPAIGKLAGYDFENLPRPDRDSVDCGLKYANNEICYPATIVVGDIIKALKSGRYDTSKIAVGMTQTGGQCRATNYLSLIKRAMVNEGFSHVPVVAIGAAGKIENAQSGFKLNWARAGLPALRGIAFADAISQMYYATAAREKGVKYSTELRDKYIAECAELMVTGKSGRLVKLLKKAVADFNGVPAGVSGVPAVGVVGEIYIKYNSFGHFGIIDWLVRNNVEVVVPPLLEFFLHSIVNTAARARDFVAREDIGSRLAKLVARAVEAATRKLSDVMEKFRYYRPTPSIVDAASMASEIMSLNHQYGEGWLISAEVASMSRQGVNEIVCVQPFGCIANHVVGKGMEAQIKRHYPGINMLFLDFDPGTAEVNVHNRLHFLVQNSCTGAETAPGVRMSEMLD